MDQLWVPVLTHYSDGSVDPGRMRKQMRSLRPLVRSILVAGSTGDGWELGAKGFNDVLETLRDPEAFPLDVDVMIGLLRPSTDGVLERLDQARTFLGRTSLAARIVGVAVCPPVGGKMDQASIIQHYDSVLDASPWPVSIYQLPQVTHCSMEPGTIATLARHRNVAMFKDSSGVDLVARADGNYGDLLLVRGAEGEYAEHLRPKGRYHGWLLSTGNAFAAPLRRILQAHAAGQEKPAAELSQQLSADVDMLFKDAGAVPFGNAFSNANRAADHVLAHGIVKWRDVAAPETISGQLLPWQLLEGAERVVSKYVPATQLGYLCNPARDRNSLG